MNRQGSRTGGAGEGGAHTTERHRSRTTRTRDGLLVNLPAYRPPCRAPADRHPNNAQNTLDIDCNTHRRLLVARAASSRRP